MSWLQNTAPNQARWKTGHPRTTTHHMPSSRKRRSVSEFSTNSHATTPPRLEPLQLKTNTCVSRGRSGSKRENKMKVAIYAYSASDMSRTESIKNQIRHCKDCADNKGWIVMPDCVRSDAGFSGVTLTSRVALSSLIADVKTNPRPFDGIIFDDTSRLSRNLGDALRIAEELEFHGVFLYFVNQQLDSRDHNFRKILAIQGRWTTCLYRISPTWYIAV